MPIDKLFGGNIALAGKAMDIRSRRQGMIQSNIANMETPGYKPQDLPFSRVMERTMTGQGELARTDPRHLAAEPATGAGSLGAGTENRPVDLDEEMVKLAENQLMYEVSARILTKKFEGMKLVIDEGGK